MKLERPPQVLGPSHAHGSRSKGTQTPVPSAPVYTLESADLAAVGRLRSDRNRLGFALQLVLTRVDGTLPRSVEEAAAEVIHCVAEQLEIRDVGCLGGYDSSHIRFVHARQVVEHDGWRELSQGPLRLGFLRWLVGRARSGNEPAEVLLELARSYLADRNILRPAETTLTRWVGAASARATQWSYRQIVATANAAELQRLEKVLSNSAPGEKTALMAMRRPLLEVSVKGVCAALERLKAIQALPGRDLLPPNVPSGRVEAFARELMSTPPSDVARWTRRRRQATLVAWAIFARRWAQDEVLDLLTSYIGQVFARTAHAAATARTARLADFDAAAFVLCDVCELLCDPGVTDDALRPRVFSRIGRARLEAAMITVKTHAAEAKNDLHRRLASHGVGLRRIWPSLVQQLELEGTPENKPVIDAWRFLRSVASQKQPGMNEAPREFIGAPWAEAVIRPNGTIDATMYTWCVLDRVFDGLKRRDIFAQGSSRWVDPRSALLDGMAWTRARPELCRTLGLPETPEDVLATMAQELDEAYHRAAMSMDQCNEVKIVTKRGGRPLLSIGRLAADRETASTTQLRTAVHARLPDVDLSEVMLEVNAWTDFGGHLVLKGGRKMATVSAVRSACAVLMAEACNVGLSALVDDTDPAFAADRLDAMRLEALGHQALGRANARLIAYHGQLPLAQTWGSGSTASADGPRFVVPLPGTFAEDGAS